MEILIIIILLVMLSRMKKKTSEEPEAIENAIKGNEGALERLRAEPLDRTLTEAQKARRRDKADALAELVQAQHQKNQARLARRLTIDRPAWWPESAEELEYLVRYKSELRTR